MTVGLTWDWNFDMLNDLFRRVACGCLETWPRSLSQLVAANCIIYSVFKKCGLKELVSFGAKFPCIMYFQKITRGFPPRKEGMGQELIKMSKEEDRPSHIEEQTL